VKYVIVSPVRNEAKFLPLTLESLVRQTVRPRCWVIVNDGSTDDTGRMADEAAGQHGWIRVVHRADRGFRQAGGGVMDAFYSGYQLLAGETWDYVVKLDGDLSFAPDYFEKCFARFDAEPRLGIGGGLICNRRDGALVAESTVDPVFHVRGATKIYRAACWRAIGGLLRAPGWDTLDEVKANMLGWKTRTFRDLPVVHHRPAGGAYGTWPNFVKNGLANYIAGYHPLFMLSKCARRVFVKPYVVQAAGLLAGFLKGYLQGIPRVEDPALIRYFRRQQLNRLLGRQSLWSESDGPGGVAQRV
jgi:biofilm PGA synthesis N-glycosyltransferase PgaC